MTKTITEDAFAIAELLHINTKSKIEKRQYQALVAPIISNTIFAREQELKQEERMNIVIGLAKTDLPHGTLTSLLKQLNLTIKI